MRSIRFAFDLIGSQFKKFLLSVLLMAVTLLLVMFTVMIYAGEHYGYISCDMVLSQNVKNTGKLRLLNYDELGDKVVLQFFKEAYEREEIECIGCTMEYGVEDPSDGELFGQQEGYTVDYQNVMDGLVEMKCMQSYVAKLCDFNIKEGWEIEELDCTKPDTNYLYLGAGYTDIDIGTEYVGSYGTHFIVAGILEDNQRFINTSLLDRYDTEVLDYSQDCSYAIFCIENDSVQSDACWIASADGYTIEQAIDAAREVGEKYGVTFSYETVQDMYESASSDNHALLSYLLKVLIVVIVSTLLMLITIQIVTVLQGAKNYGIMYSVGFSRKEVNHMLLCKHIITALCSLVISIGGCMYIASSRYGSEDMSYMMKTILSHYVFPVAISFVIIIVAISYIVTNMILKKLTPTKLIRSRY